MQCRKWNKFNFSVGGLTPSILSFFNAILASSLRTLVRRYSSQTYVGELPWRVRPCVCIRVAATTSSLTRATGMALSLVTIYTRYLFVASALLLDSLARRDTSLSSTPVSFSSHHPILSVIHPVSTTCQVSAWLSMARWPHRDLTSSRATTIECHSSCGWTLSDFVSFDLKVAFPF